MMPSPRCRARLLIGPAVALLLAALSGTAHAQSPRSVANCERVKGDLAYNQCLASFGPPARSGGSPSPDGGASPPAGQVAPDDDGPGEEPRGGRIRRGASAGTALRRRGGRQSAA